MSSHEKYDKILNSYILEIPQSPDNHSADDLYYLDACGYLNVNATEEGSIYMVNLTSKGFRFIQEGGFTKLFENEQEIAAHKKLEKDNLIATTKAAKGARTISIISIIIAALSLIVAVIALSRKQ